MKQKIGLFFTPRPHPRFRIIAVAAAAMVLLAVVCTATPFDPPTNVIPVLGMTWITPGRFVMGSPVSDPDSRPNERPQTVVTITHPFFIGVHPVTQAEFMAVLGNNPSYFTGNTNCPVETVSWYDATNYCVTLTQNERAAGRIPAGWAYRLPYEAEWEYCCRAGASTTRFSYGDDLSYSALANYAWYAADSNGSTQPVEQKLGNPWRLMDMQGNVFQWCLDWFGSYPGGSVTNYRGPATGSYKVVRGGSWSYAAAYCRAAERDGTLDDNYPARANSDIGFRIVLSNWK